VLRLFVGFLSASQVTRKSIAGSPISGPETEAEVAAWTRLRLLNMTSKSDGWSEGKQKLGHSRMRWEHIAMHLGHLLSSARGGLSVIRKAGSGAGFVRLQEVSGIR
jgi:hypothetical protein